MVEEEAQESSGILSRHLERPKPALRSSSQPASVSRRLKQRRSANHVASKPANQHVISSIIESLESTSSGPADPTSFALVSSGDSQHSLSLRESSLLSRSSSRQAPSLPAPTLRRSISFGLESNACTAESEGEEEGNAVNDDDHNSQDDCAAAFPIVPTSRRNPRIPSRTSSPFASPAASVKDYLRSASRNSRSSLSISGVESAKGKLARSNSRLSVESWSKRLSTSSRTSLDDIPSHSSSRRQHSQETLRSQPIREERIAAIITRSAPITPIRETAAFMMSPATPTLARISPAGTRYADNKIHESREEVKQVTVDLSPAKSASPRKNSIADAIPLRVSSLNRTPSPRQIKSKLRNLDKSDRAKSPPDEVTGSPKVMATLDNTTDHSLTNDLDEDTTTVKRIKELQQRKENRLKIESAAAQSHDNPAGPANPPSSTDTGTPASRKPNRDKSYPKTGNRTFAKVPDARKAHRVLGLPEPNRPAESPDRRPSAIMIPDYGQYRGNKSARPESMETPIREDFPESATSLQLSHPLDSSPTAHSSSASSYARAVHAIQDSQYEAKLSHRASKRSLSTHGGGADLTPPSTSHSSRSHHSRSNSNHLDFWSRPDVPAQSQSGAKVRRKSMSDARSERILEEELREERRNSVHVSVEDYLGAPRLNQKVRHAQNGRLISFSEVGDPKGAAVIVCVGMGLTRYVTAFYDELAATLGLRLITLDRPGVGDSEPYPERERVGPLSWPDDVVTVTQHLGISRFSLLAHSAGAIYALATTLILPHRVKGKVQLLAPWIPPSQFDTYGVKEQSPDSTRVGALPRSQRFLRVLPIPFLRAANGGLFSPSSLKPTSVRNSPALLPLQARGALRNSKPKKRNDHSNRESMILMDQVPPEKPITTMFPLPELVEEDISGLQTLRRPSFTLTATASPTDPEFTFVAEALDAAEHSDRQRRSAYSALLTERTWTLATRNSNPAVDLLVCLERHRDVGFRYVDIQRQIVITHGSEDKRVPVENIRWMGEQINRRAATNWSPDAKMELREKGGCEVRVLAGEGHGLMASPSVMADVLADIRKEWTGKRW